MTDTDKLPDPFDWCYEWDGPWGTRKFSAAKHNGMNPTRSVALYTAEQLVSYAIKREVAAELRGRTAGYLAGLEAAAKVCEQTEDEGEGPDCWGWHAKDYAKAIRALREGE